ncbi:MULTISPECIES: glycosyltransferase [Caldimonas]|uniref:glycosyltransferase n=1 Tax=Caldimonas TaxID=196013 RepID=UPI00036E96E6|nr:MULTISPECIES: glycosyltransferase [Caldimonas]GIX23099.1 MAG: glycosyl transferase [Caldimonas sp.]
MSAPHLLFVADATSVHTRRWVGAIAQRGFRCSVISRLDGEVPGAQVHALNTPPGRWPWFAALPRVRALAGQLQPDLVHGHYLTSYGFWAASLGRHPLVLSAWGSDVLVSPRHSRLVRALTGWTLRRADLVTADSRDMLEAIAAYRPRAALHQVLWGVDTTKFVAVHKTATPLRLVSLRNWEPNYRIDLVLHAAAQLRERRPGLSFELHLCGGGPLEAELRAQAQALGVDGVVRWHGRVDEDRLAEIVRNAHLAVSVPESDATSVALLEAMAAGLAVIVSDLPANRQWVDGRGGRLVPAGDGQALAQALVELAADVQTLEAMGRHNRRRVVPEVSRDEQMDRMAALYRELLTQGGR